MRHPFLLVNPHLDSADLPFEILDAFEFTTVANGKDGLEALALPTPWCGVLAAKELPDMDGLDFLGKAAFLSNAIPLLLAPDTQLAETLCVANSCSIFRVVPANTDADALATILLDTARQFTLVHNQQQLQERIQHLTLTDSLTGCYSRLHLEEHLKKELSRSLRYSHYLSVILCDIDGLKGINETLGHRAGDLVLTGLARTAQQLIRQDIDTITRWGEDEFLLVLPETPIRGAGRVANRLREQVAVLDSSVDGHPIHCTASFGVAGFAPEIADRNAVIDDLLLIAGRCLLQAKAAGGNQVLCCP